VFFIVCNVYDQATADDYDKVPIEQFGMALLRGMGWKDGDGIGKNKRYVFIGSLAA
jgi:G-patch domain